VVATALSAWLGGQGANIALGPGLLARVIGEMVCGSVVWFLAARRIRRGSFRELVETLASGAALDQKPWTKRFVDWCAPESI
jgi:hypothetical protein